MKQGFNWAGYFAPAVVMTTGGIILTMMIKRWTARSAATAAAGGSVGAAAPVKPRVDASPDELARLEKALREEDFE